MGGPKTHYTRSEMISAQNRTEELLLELILERVLKHKPMSAVEYEDEDRQDTERGYPPTPEDLAQRKGYDEGWWNCYEALSNIVDGHNEGNVFRG